MLLVDDEPPVRRAFARILEARGFAVETVGDGASALAIHQREQFDVIFSDIRMPNMTGLEFIRRIRGVDFDIPVVLITGTPSLETAQEAVELGAFRYLTKPVGREELIDAARSAGMAHEMARLKRDALRVAIGTSARQAGDLAGLQVAFQRALMRLWIAHQPIVRTDGSVFGYEALMRTDEESFREPPDVLSAADRVGRLRELSQTIRAKVAQQMLDAGDGFLVFVNMHPRDLFDPHLSSFDSPLSEFAERIVLEFTEREALENVTGVRRRIAALRAVGFRIAVDDLGAGYAGLTTFAALEPEIVKLDMSIVRDVDTDPRKQTIIASFAQLCHQMGTMIVAEGIETESEYETIVELGCDLLQGYHIGRPGPGYPASNVGAVLRD